MICIFFFLFAHILALVDILYSGNQNKFISQNLIFQYYRGPVRTIPLPPSELEAIEASFDYVLLSWSDNSNNESYFIIERHPEGESFARYDTVEVNITFFIDYRVDPNTTYYYRVSAVNSDGESGFSNEISATTLSMPHNPPQAPTNLDVSFNGSNGVILQWDDNSDNENKFLIYRGTDIGGISMFDSTGIDITQYIDYAIESETIYFYYVVAANNYGLSAPTSTVSILVPEVVQSDSTVLRVLFTTSNSIHLGWEQQIFTNPRYSILKYEADTSYFVADGITETYFCDSALLANTGYTYQLVTNDQNGHLIYSNLINAFTLPWFTQERISDSLIVQYYFPNRTIDRVPDISWYESPVDLVITDTADISSDIHKCLKIENGTMLISDYDISNKINEAVNRTDEITLECWLKTSDQIQLPEVKIVSFGNEHSTNFSLGCTIDPWADKKVRYHVNLTTRTTDQHGNPSFAIESPLESDVLQHIVFVHNRSGDEMIYVNGKVTELGFRPSGFDDWNDNSRLVFGNSINGDLPWLGSLYMFSLYNKALSETEILQNYLASPFITPEITLNPTDLEVFVTPNPGNDIISVSVFKSGDTIDISEKYYIQLLTFNGLPAITEKINSTINSTPLHLDISGLPEGLYLLSLFNQHQLIAQEKVLILR